MKNNALRKSKLNTHRLVTCSILSALSVVFMLIGAITDVLDLTMIMLASLCIAFAVIEINERWAWLVWGVTSALSLILLPSKAAAMFYLMAGFYPIMKAAFERLHPVPAWILKFSLFNTVQLFYILAAQKLLGLSGEGYEFVAGALLFNNFVFLAYDFALTTFITFYLIRLKKRIHFPPLK